MAAPLVHLNQRANESWLLGIDAQSFATLALEQFQTLQQFRTPHPPVILLAEPDPLRFLANFIAAVAADCPIFLGNPHWVAAEWQQVFQQVQPDLILGTVPALAQPPQPPRSPSPLPGWIMIPTGGSSGRIRFAIHTWETLTASVTGFQQYFQVDRIHSCCVLPLYHVSGLMQFIRSFISGGQLAILPGRSLETPVNFDPEAFFLSLVPTQLQRLLHIGAIDPLARFQTVLLGGAPAWDELLKTAADYQIRLAPTYGMTETASQVVTLKPEDFLQGKPGCGQVLPHAQVTIGDEAGQPLDRGQTGIITIQASSLTLGYYPEPFQTPAFQTDDLGFFDSEGYLHLVGRRSSKIITGGENVFPAEVEAAIRSSGLVADVGVVGVPDAEWGEVVAAVYVPIAPDLVPLQLQTELEQRLCKFKRPKRWLAVEALPRNAQGKLNRNHLQQLLAVTQE